MAYATLGVASANMSKVTESLQALQKAYELRDRASEHEKLYIQAHYYDEFVMDFDKTLATYAEWRQTYPRETLPHDNAALIYGVMGQPQKALDLASEALRLDSKDRYAYANLAGAYLALDRFDEAKSICDQAKSQKLESVGIHLISLDLHTIRGDQSAYDHEIELARGTPDETLILLWKANGQARAGKIQLSRQTWQQIQSESAATGDKDFGADALATEAFNEFLLGYPAAAKQKAAQALELSQDRDVRVNAALVLALTGDQTKSSALLADVTRDFPENQYLHSLMAPMIQAALDIEKNQPAEAVAALEPTRPYEFGIGPHGAGFGPIYLRGLAYLQLKDGVKAAVEFKRILDHKGVGAADPQYSLAHLNLGRAYMLQGDPGKARTAYQDFLAAWKDADPDVPVLIAAKAEYEKLK
jgi:tetratricopeptide (TPR) repeat protein